MPPEVVHLSPDLEDLVPGYLDRMRAEVVRVKGELAASNFPSLESAGHKMAGSGGGYGFPMITQWGRAIESSAKRKDGAGIAQALDALEAFLKGVQCVFDAEE